MADDIVRYDNQKILDVEINKEVRKAFLDYSMSVIVQRALPDVRDGLKPVHRRILYTMFENNLYPDRPYRKCADTVGSVLGRYHPHGDASVYDAMVRLAQSFSMRYMLVDGHGNFGTVDGDPPAAYRYTESRMSKISMRMLQDIDKDTVDFQPNYDDRLKEPTVLPTRFPNLLVNGTSGIAVGMATNIPPHNMKEVVDGVNYLIDHPDCDTAELMQFIKGPDFPTAGIIMGTKGIKEAYSTGRGKIYIRARAEIVEDKADHYKIIITELPYQVKKAELITKIAELAKEKRLEGISGIKDLTNRKGMHVEISLKRDANAQVVLNNLYKMTQMQITFGVIMLALVDGVPRILTLKQMLQNYIKFREEVITRRVTYDLKKAQARAHILEGLKKAIDIVDDIIATIRSCKGGKAEAKQAIMEKFDFDDPQATAIVNFQLGQLAGLEIEKIVNELEELENRIADYTDILQHEERVFNIIKEESAEIVDKFGDDRKTEISAVIGSVDDEDLIPVEESILTLTNMGYMKRMTVDTYKAQNRGGRGIMGMSRREEDVAKTMFTCSSHDVVFLFTNTGKVFRKKAYEIPASSRTGKGMNVVNLLPLEKGETVSAMVKIPQEESRRYLCMVTKKGIIKRTDIDEYKHIRQSGIIAINLDEGDELAYVEITDGTRKLVVATHGGMCICFDENDARLIGRTARGVRAISLDEDDYVVGFAASLDGYTLLTVSETGFGRRSDFDDYRVQNRGGKGLINYRTDQFGKVAMIAPVKDDDDVIMITSDGIVIRTHADQISTFKRPSKGVKVMRVNEGEKIATISVVDRLDEEAESEPQETESETDTAGAKNE
ncbi:MAG TPA: DNA gyrase subunit A [Candidatus Eubacterium faecipullorum]|uniref:DNA gyrase subunit A n=1 Tax=Candidatus Eubacterium faecipullorum TaxID=2838571 RepID=A0A9D1UFZ6_9FIRM|nr:DNA gyrase subunit A [Candidatus Eubacterium faecipullorum]